MKAIGTGWKRGVTWRDFEVANLPSGKPTLRLHGVAADIASKLGVRNISLSLTHTAELGMAHVMATDSKGNVYVGETVNRDRIQRQPRRLLTAGNVHRDAQLRQRRHAFGHRHVQRRQHDHRRPDGTRRRWAGDLQLRGDQPG